MNESSLQSLQILRECLVGARHTVFFGGAGVSTESGIPDFRGTNGVYTAAETPEYLLSRTCLCREPERFFDFYRDHMLYPAAKPNRAHTALAVLEASGKLSAVITQNIDGLHTMAGSRRVLELHGTTSRCRCDACGRRYPGDIVHTARVPLCPECGGMIRPDVVLYEEGLDQLVWQEAASEITQADLLIAAGSSLVVNPAASLVGSFSGKTLAIVNYSPTPYDRYADLLLRESVGEVLEALSEIS